MDSRGRGKRPAHLAFLDEIGGTASRGRGRPSEPEPPSDRARFLRDEHGELIVIKPGEKQVEEEKTAEDLHYEAYVQGRAVGAIRAINGYSECVDRAAEASSGSARDAEDREREGNRTHAPARVHNAARLKRPGERGDGRSEETTKTAAQSMDEAMRRAREASDGEKEDEDLSLSAAALADKSMGACHAVATSAGARSFSAPHVVCTRSTTASRPDDKFTPMRPPLSEPADTARSGSHRHGTHCHDRKYERSPQTDRPTPKRLS